MHDENTGRDEKPTQFGRKNVQLLLNTELSDDWVRLPLGRIRRGELGHLVLDGNFIPPCLQITASPRLMMLQRRLIEILEEKNRTLSHRDPGAETTYTGSEIMRFWLLHTVNSNLVRLRHLYFSKRGHPEELYAALAGLAGALCTFGLDADPMNLPLYDHEHLDECFDQLDQHIRIRLEVIIPTNALVIPLKPVSGSFYTGTITDSRCLASGDWILGIQSSLEKLEVISKASQLVKVCSSEFIGKLVQRALPGLTLTHLPSPPPAVKYSPNVQYFNIGKVGPCWEHIVQTREVGIYVPDGLPQPKLELTAILPT
jgi:type VI secretion system protein ImpJ